MTSPLITSLCFVLVGLCVILLDYRWITFGGKTAAETNDSNTTLDRNHLLSVSTSSSSAWLTRSEQWGVWVGNMWVPPSPHWKLFSPSQLRTFYKHKHVLWIGDSTARRTATTLYGILNATSSPHVPESAINHPSVIDVNKKRISEPCDHWMNQTHQPWLCRPMPYDEDGDSGNHTTTSKNDEFVYLSINCLTALEVFLKDEIAGTSSITSNLDSIVIALGIWESVRPWDCRENGENKRDAVTIQTSTIQLLALLQQKAKRERNMALDVVWRTSGYSADEKTDVVDQLNEQAMTTIEEINAAAFTSTEQAETTISSSSSSSSSSINGQLMYVDFGGAIRPRSFGADRIVGDIKPHYGLEARYTLLQMVTNQLFTASSVREASTAQ